MRNHWMLTLLCLACSCRDSTPMRGSKGIAVPTQTGLPAPGETDGGRNGKTDDGVPRESDPSGEVFPPHTETNTEIPTPIPSGAEPKKSFPWWELIPKIINALPTPDPNKPQVPPQPDETPRPVATPKPALTPKPVVTPKPVTTPRPVITPRPTVQPTPKPVVKEKPLRLTIMQSKYEAWWKNCLGVAVYDAKGTLIDVVDQIACNKDENMIGKTVDLRAKQWPECNKVRVFISTYKNKGDTCSSNMSKPGFICNGPYDMSAPDWKRNSAGSPTFFRFYDARTVSQHDPIIKIDFPWDDIENAAQTYRGDGSNRWIVGFYEDQPTLTGAGVDFNDYAFDVKGEGVKFTLEGSNITCDSQ